MLDDAFSTGAAFDRNITDIISALTMNHPTESTVSMTKMWRIIAIKMVIGIAEMKMEQTLE